MLLTIIKNEECDVRSSIKILRTTNRVRYKRINPQSSCPNALHDPKKPILSKIFQFHISFLRYLIGENSLLVLLDT